MTASPIRGGVTGAILGPLLTADPHRPRLTWYGEGRTELSTASLANWSAKTAGLLDHELGAGTGDAVAVLAAPSWQVVPVYLGAWWAGLTVRDTGTAGTVALFTVASPVRGPDEIFVLSTHPFGLPVDGLTGGQRDFGTAVRAHADRYSALPIDAEAGALETAEPDGLEAGADRAGQSELGDIGGFGDAEDVQTVGTTRTVSELILRARQIAAVLGPQPRVLVTDEMSPTGIVVVLLGALAADGSLVVAAGSAAPDSAADLVAVAASENVTCAVACDVPGVPSVAV